MIKPNTLMLGIAGKARTGKDELALYLTRTYNFTPVRIAQPLEDLLLRLLGDRIPEHYRTTNKEAIIPGIGQSWRQLMQAAGQWHRDNHGEASLAVGALDGFFGTIEPDGIRDFIRLIKIKSLPTYPLFTDVRLPVEADIIRHSRGTILHIQNPNAAPANPDITEAGITALPDEIVIVNDGMLADLYAAADNAIAQLMPRVARTA
jgi:hypothetical protein